MNKSSAVAALRSLLVGSLVFAASVSAVVNFAEHDDGSATWVFTDGQLASSLTPEERAQHKQAMWIACSEALRVAASEGNHMGVGYNTVYRAAAVVPEPGAIDDDTILNNLAAGNSAATPEERAAARQNAIRFDCFQNLPDRLAADCYPEDPEDPEFELRTRCKVAYGANCRVLVSDRQFPLPALTADDESGVADP